MSPAPNAADRSAAGWVALGAVGVLFLLVGVTDLVLAWVPSRFGDADWELATVTTMFNNLPVPAMGLALALAGATAAGPLRARRFLAAVAAVLVIWSLVAALLFALTLPLALGAVAEAVPRRALLASTVKTSVQIVAYTGFFAWAIRFALRAR